ncbi:lipoyltransferase 1 isoform X3 [Andrena cerasifolii]|uniref:lipoyltransferase 1 isoform X3 n=1 Tax=Andrena cerasifolii TaxID=2819439 RepID=UPI00403765C7
MSLINRFLIVVERRVRCSGLSRVARFSTSFKEKQGDPNDSIKKSVFISQSTNVFTNLALEDWLYRHYNFTNHHVLLLWRNDPCVVIGRHQNPWIEHNAQLAEKRSIALVRRNSGGGTVYHDNGNLNLSFFTPRERYDRKYNLGIITRALYREWGVKADINKREDIVVEGEFKVSFNNGVETNATESTRSPIKNLIDVNSHICMDKLIDAIGWEYLRTKALVLEDGGQDLIQRQKGFQFINPTEDWFPGLNELISTFRSWEWNYGKTPKFRVTRVLDVLGQNEKFHQFNLVLEIQDGVIEEIKMRLPAGLISNDFNEDASVISDLRGTRYDYEVTENIIAAIGCKTVTVSTTQTVDKSNMIATQ